MSPVQQLQEGLLVGASDALLRDQVQLDMLLILCRLEVTAYELELLTRRDEHDRWSANRGQCSQKRWVI
jgi:hypothetical protein